MYGSWRSKNDLLLYLGPRSFYELLVDTGSLRELPDTSMRWAQFLPGSEQFVHVSFDPPLIIPPPSPTRATNVPV